ncbi:MAG: caspase family protein [Sphaerochaeta associata]|uniref:caspase family protein n=1 Tax=Sphaerochaeta associata TaxID=1129264 RepID=UPI002B1F401F|nr:caspase family protein [Sphaerochaeta associata]MEA5029130.1 caspase family protein [Sphaerochaeta associata]
MKRCVLLVVLGVVLMMGLYASNGGWYALVVGNGAYEKTTKLANPVNDAGDVADMLSDLGFKVRLETNTTLSRMEGAVREFSKEAREAKASTTLFFYAGHGVQYEGINYLLPVDADIQRDYELRSKALSMDMVTSALEDTKSGFNLVMLDACRDNPFASGRGGSRGLGVMGGGTAESMVVFATAPGSVAQDGDGDGRNSPFTAALKQHLATPDLEVRQLVAAVSRSVQDMTRGMQIPWVNTSFTGQFFFLTAQQQLAKAESDAKQLQGELAALEAEIAKRQSAILAETDTYARQQLQLEQQRAKALENSKKLEVQRMEQLREQAAYQLAVQEKELAEKRALEATVAGQQEELARQAQMRRAELAELDRKKSLSSDALQRLDMIAKMEKAIEDIKESFALSVTGTKKELERLGLQQVSSYRTTSPQDPWETNEEFEARVTEYQAGLVADGEAKIREIEHQRDAEVGKIQVQLGQAKRELQGMQFTLGPTMTKVTVDKFDAANKRFPIKVSSLDDLLPFEASLFFKIDSTDRNVLQREYSRVDDAQKANALVGTIVYSVEEFSPGIWKADATNVIVNTLLEGTPSSAGMIANELSDGIGSRNLSYVIEGGGITQVYGILPIRSELGAMNVYVDGKLLGTADSTTTVLAVAKTARISMQFELISSNKSSAESIEINAGFNTEYVPRSFVFKIGDTGPAGGYIFYNKGYYSDGWRYLEAAPAEYEFEEKVWGGYRTEVGGTATTIGSGKSNTEKIVAKFGNAEPMSNKTDYAAKVCADLVVTKNGVVYDDWFLPSKDELNLIYLNLKDQGLGGVYGVYYWSSSEGSADYAWNQHWYNGGQDGNGRYDGNRVRPVRAF